MQSLFSGLMTRPRRALGFGVVLTLLVVSTLIGIQRLDTPSENQHQVDHRRGDRRLRAETAARLAESIAANDRIAGETFLMQKVGPRPVADLAAVAQLVEEMKVSGGENSWQEF